MSVGVSLETAVKSTVLDSICEREAIVSYADEYQIALDEKLLQKLIKGSSF